MYRIGNLPASFSNQVQKFLYFLNALKDFMFHATEEIIVKLDETGENVLAKFKKESSYGKSNDADEWSIEYMFPHTHTHAYKTYYSDGIQQFIKEKKDDENDIHAVTHSHLMQHCLETIGVPQAKIKENLWSIVVSPNGFENSTDYTQWDVWLVSGILADIEKSRKDPNVLCDSWAYGGKRTKRIKATNRKRRLRKSRRRM